MVAFRDEELTGNTAIAYRISTINGSDTFILKDFASLFNDIEDHRSDLDANEAPPLVRAESLKSPVLDLLAVRWVVTRATPGDLSHTDAIDRNPVLAARGDYIYERPSAMPVLRTICLQHVADDVAAQAYVRKASRAQLESTAVTPDAVPPRLCGPSERKGQAARVRAFRIGVSQVSAVVDAQQPSGLLLSEIDYPGWQARIDGGRAPLLRLDGGLMGTVVPAGRHQVRFSYTPDTLPLGLALAGAAVTTLALALGLEWRRRRPIEPIPVSRFAEH
jgi:hypothetical protein